MKSPASKSESEDAPDAWALGLLPIHKDAVPRSHTPDGMDLAVWTVVCMCVLNCCCI